ncbi:MAG: formate dehydrogenase subunit delta [Pseudomonadota bacterium]
MANQIADFFRAYPQEEAVAGIAGHFRQFWDPRMRRQILEHLDKGGGSGLDPLCLDALADLRAKKTQTP